MMNPSQLVRLKDEDLRAYVQARLRRENNDPPFYPDRDDEPEYFLIETVETSRSGGFKKRFKNVAVSLLKDVDPAKLMGEYVSRLLYLIEYLEIKEAGPRLRELWAEREMFRGVKGYYTEPDLLIQLISAVAQFNDKSSLLKDLKPCLDDPDHAPAAFAVIIEIGPEDALDNMIPFIATAHKENQAIWIEAALDFMIEIYGKGDDRKGAIEVNNLLCRLKVTCADEWFWNIVTDQPDLKPIMETKTASAPKIIARDRSCRMTPQWHMAFP